MQKNKIPIRPLLAVLGSILSVQIGATIAKELFPALGAAVTATLRIGLSALILLAVNRPGLKTLTREQWKAVIPYGLCLGAMNLIYYLALSRIPLGIAVTLEFIGPLLLVVLSSKRLIEFLWVLLAAGGIALMTPWNNTNIDLFGAGMALLAGAFWAGYIVLGRRVSAVLDGRPAVTIGMLFALVVALPFAFSSGMVNFKSSMIIPALALALFCSAVPFSLEMYGLKYIPTKNLQHPHEHGTGCWSHLRIDIFERISVITGICGGYISSNCEHRGNLRQPGGYGQNNARGLAIISNTECPISNNEVKLLCWKFEIHYSIFFTGYPRTESSQNRNQPRKSKPSPLERVG